MKEVIEAAELLTGNGYTGITVPTTITNYQSYISSWSFLNEKSQDRETHLGSLGH